MRSGDNIVSEFRLHIDMPDVVFDYEPVGDGSDWLLIIMSDTTRTHRHAIVFRPELLDEGAAEYWRDRFEEIVSGYAVTAFIDRRI